MTVRIVLADDHTLFREGLRELLSTDPDFQVVGEGSSGDEAIALAEEHRPDVLLLDVEMPGPGAKAVIVALRTAMPELNVIILTMHDSAGVVRDLLQSGAAAYLVKNIARDQLVAAVRSVSRRGEGGFTVLTDQGTWSADAVVVASGACNVAAAQAGFLVQTEQQAAKVAGSKGVAGTHRLDDGDGQRGNLHPGAVPVERYGADGLVLDDQDVGIRQEPSELGFVGGSEGVFGLVFPDQHDVGEVRQPLQDTAVLSIPKGCPPVHVEADGPAVPRSRQQYLEHVQAAGGERSSYPAEVNQPGLVQEGSDGRVGECFASHGRGGGTLPIVQNRASGVGV